MILVKQKFIQFTLKGFLRPKKMYHTHTQPGVILMKAKTSRLELINEYETAPDSALFSQETVAAILDCSLATIERDRWIGKGIPFSKFGRLVRYRKTDIREWLEKHKSFQSTTEMQLKAINNN
jgi:excisionase family DNA binding protein